MNTFGGFEISQLFLSDDPSPLVNVLGIKNTCANMNRAQRLLSKGGDRGRFGSEHLYLYY